MRFGCLYIFVIYLIISNLNIPIFCEKRSIKQCCLSWVSSSKQKCRTAVLLPCTIFSVSVELSRNIHWKTHYINILRTKSHLNHLVWFHFKGKLASCFLGSLRELLKLLSSYSSNWHFVNFLFFCFFFPFTFIRTLFVHWSFSWVGEKQLAECPLLFVKMACFWCW